MNAALIKLLGGVLLIALVALGAGVWGIAKGTKTDKARSDLVISDMKFKASEESNKLRAEALKLKDEYAAYKQAMIDKLTEVYRERDAEKSKNQRTAAALARTHDDAGGLRDTIREFARASRAGGETGDDLKACRERAETLGALLDDSVRVQEALAGEAEDASADYRTLFNGWPGATAVKAP